jgi:hypothetical protein
MFLKAPLVVAFVLLLAPQEPDLGFGRPHIASPIAGPEFVRREILEAIERVRTDFKANLHPAKPF